MGKTVTTDPKRLKAQAREAAISRLCKLHEDELRDLMKEEHEARGVEYKPRLSSEERARQQVLDLFDQYPGLKDDLAEGLLV